MVDLRHELSYFQSLVLALEVGSCAEVEKFICCYFKSLKMWFYKHDLVKSQLVQLETSIAKTLRKDFTVKKGTNVVVGS